MLTTKSVKNYVQDNDFEIEGIFVGTEDICIRRNTKTMKKGQTVTFVVQRN